MVNTKVILSGLELDNPVIPASGTFGYGYEFAELYSEKTVYCISGCKLSASGLLWTGGSILRDPDPDPFKADGERQSDLYEACGAKVLQRGHNPEYQVRQDPRRGRRTDR